MDEPTSGEEPSPKTVSIDYIKSTGFRVIHVDGAYGGLTPQLKIHMAVYSERNAIPKRTTHIVENDNSLGPPIKTDARAEIVRELEADIVMDRTVAVAVRDWLNDKIERLDEARLKVAEEAAE